MNRLTISVVDKDRICISGIPPLLVTCLRELPRILEKRDTPKARSRLFPAPTRDNAKANQDWEHLIVPELRLLFESAGNTVAQDLANLEKESTDDSYQITFSAAHLNAWISALNEARLILGELFDITEPDMAEDKNEVTNPKQLAVWKIRVLGWLLGELVDFSSGDSDVNDERTIA